MPTSKTTIDSLAATSAEARTFVTAFRTKLEAVGFTTTGDSGQFDEATGTASNIQSTLAGHKMFRTPDSDPSHSVMPIFIKARIRTSITGNLYSQTITPHFGTGSDGASNLNDAWLPHSDTAWPQLQYADITNMWVVRNSLLGGFVMGGTDADNYDDSAGGWFFHRTVDASGAPTTEGYYALTFGNPLGASGGTPNVSIYNSAGYAMPGVYASGSGSNFALPSTENYYDRARDKWRGENHPGGGGHRGFHIPDYPSASVDGSNAVHYPYVGNRFDGLDRPLPGLVAYYKAHHAVGDTFTLTRYGVARTFLATALRVQHASYGNNRMDWRLAVLWE